MVSILSWVLYLNFIDQLYFDYFLGINCIVIYAISFLRKERGKGTSAIFLVLIRISKGT